MRIAHLTAACVLIGTTLLLAACGGSGANDEAAIRDQNKKWLEAIVAKDPSAIAQIYAEDGTMLPPNAPKASGRDAVQKGWEEMFKIPGVQLTFDTERFVFAKAATWRSISGPTNSPPAKVPRCKPTPASRS